MSSLATGGLRAETAAAVDAVSAGLRLAINSAASHEVSIKQGRDVVTTADLAVESTMRALLGVDGEAWDLGSDTLVAAASPRTHGALLALMPDVA